MRAKIRDTEIYFDVDGCGLVVEEQGIRQKPVAFIIHGGPGVDHTSYRTHLISFWRLSRINRN